MVEECADPAPDGFLGAIGGFPNGLMHSDLLRLRVDPTHHNAVIVAAQLRFNRSFILQLEMISGGAIMAGMNVGRLKALHAIAPPKALQDEYADRIESLNVAMGQARRSAQIGDNLFCSLQHRAFVTVRPDRYPFQCQGSRSSTFVIL